MYVHEIFASINGETTNSGVPTTFVRLFGCNVNCAYCDQPQDLKDRKKMSIRKVVDEVRSKMINNVCITGGEPLLQPDIFPVIYELVGSNYNVIIETSGTVEIEDVPNRSFHYIMDIKTPSSKVTSKNVYSNLAKLIPNDEVKFVIANREDYDFMKKVLKKYPTQAKVLVSPMFSKDSNIMIGKELVDWILYDSLNVRVQVQIHKILNVL